MILISVDRNVILENIRLGLRSPPLIIEVKGVSSSIYATEIYIPGPCRLVYRPDQHDEDDPTATVWIEVEGDVQCL